MPLQSSGQISLNDLHVEAGGTSGTQASMNDTDIRGLLNASANSQMTFSSFYGASASLWDAVVTPGSYTPLKSPTQYGYSHPTLFNYGSISDATIDSPFNNARLASCHYENNNVHLQLYTGDPNTGNAVYTGGNSNTWTSLSIGSQTFLKSNILSYYDPNPGSYTATTIIFWRWGNVATNPFAGSSTVDVVFA
jgi:hypothetical protein